MPSDAFARHTAELRRARPRDGREASDQLLEQMRAGDGDAPPWAPPEGVAAEEVDAGGRPATVLNPDGARGDSAVLHLHGGAYAVEAFGAHLDFAARLATGARRVVVALDYRLAPEHPHPAGLDDATAAHGWLVDRTLPGGIALSGESAGAGLALALLVRLRDGGAPLPLGAALLCPWADLTGEAAWRQPGSDDGEPVLRRATLAEASRMYDAGAGFDDPTISPARADLSGLPPLFVQWGTAEALAADACALAGRAAAAGVDVTADPWEGMWHVWQAAGDAFPEAGEAIARAGAFLAEQLPPAPGSRRRGRDMHG